MIREFARLIAAIKGKECRPIIVYEEPFLFKINAPRVICFCSSATQTMGSLGVD
jgi:hypothetical protein